MGHGFESLEKVHRQHHCALRSLVQVKTRGYGLGERSIAAVVERPARKPCWEAEVRDNKGEKETLQYLDSR